MSNIVEIRDVTLTCENKKIFNKLSFDIESGSFVTIMGANGSGKSRLAHILYGILPYLGSVKIAGKVITNKTVEEIRANVGIVFENPESLFITDNVLDELSCSAISDKDVDYIVKKLEISHLLGRKHSSLSGGEKQLVAIASALLSRPLVLVFDEGINMLDCYNRTKVMNVLRQYNKKGLTVINITQNSEELLYGNHVILFDNGEIILNEPLKNALLKDKEFINARVNLPFMADLCTKLKYYNLIQKIELDKVRLVNYIWK